jgi:hypothetical protein
MGNFKGMGMGRKERASGFLQKLGTPLVYRQLQMIQTRAIIDMRDAEKIIINSHQPGRPQ